MNKKDKFKLFQWMEVVIWIIILGLVLFGIKEYNYKKHKELKKYQIFMSDVDGLISGSSVRMMGVPIGYVEGVHIVGDEVYVKFVLTENDITLPKGVIATVEFNGMAGSKSLELYPPDAASLAGNKLIEVNAPKRLHDSLGLLCDMFNQLGAIIQKSGYFSSEVSQFMPKSSQKTLKDSEDTIKTTADFIENLSQKRSQFMNFKKDKGAENE